MIFGECKKAKGGEIRDTRSNKMAIEKTVYCEERELLWRWRA